ncbi:hypothetical protein GIS00_08220 [Nakamurella sp. YIM 132087]|uniref:Uncharacterized protein n=1 Tax=Nakamurella alba TaxID=2665158 RepID=A0A7K1FIH6_9ACTN|nr:hypothetical protein [Nakamurella alba]MTD13927.1 hypothetical protein [Nakamurella alba]
MTIRIMLVDGPHRGTSEGLLMDRSFEAAAPAPGETFELDSQAYAFTGTSQVEEDGEYWHATKDSIELFLWLKDLSSATRAHLLAHPNDPVPTEMIAELVHSGQAVASDAYWPESDVGPSGFYLRESVQQYLEEHQPLER